MGLRDIVVRASPKLDREGISKALYEKKVKTIQRYQCDFCKYRSVKHIVAIHEKRCFRNPNRFCDFCGNTGKVMVEVDESQGTEVERDCPYCASFDKKKLKEIKIREKNEK